MMGPKRDNAGKVIPVPIAAHPALTPQDNGGPLRPYDEKIATAERDERLKQIDRELLKIPGQRLALQDRETALRREAANLSRMFVSPEDLRQYFHQALQRAFRCGRDDKGITYSQDLDVLIEQSKKAFEPRMSKDEFETLLMMEKRTATFMDFDGAAKLCEMIRKYVELPIGAPKPEQVNNG